MKVLYININGEDIQSTDSIEVIGAKEDAIVNGFYYTLGTEILRGVNGIGSITKSSLITEFAKEKPDEYNCLEAQWKQLKCILLGEEPEGEFTITLPKEYLDWLQYNANPNYSEIYSQKYQGKKDISFDIDIEELYEDCVYDLQRKAVRFLLTDDRYRNFDKLVVNDDLITKNSPIIHGIRKRVNCIQFVSLNEYNNLSGDIAKDNAPLALKRNEKCIYAVKKETGEYTFLNSSGDRLGDDDYYIVDCVDNEHILSHVVVTNVAGTTLYYISSDGAFHLIGDYNIETGYIKGRSSYSDRKWWKYTVEILQEKYILYRNNREYSLYEIYSNDGIQLISKFASKMILWQDLYVIKNYIVGDDYTISLSTGEIVKVSGFRYACLIGFLSEEPIYLASNKEDWYIGNPKGASVVNAEGLFLWRFNYEEITPLTNNLYVVSNINGKEGVIDLSGKLILKCKYSDIELVNQDVLKIDYDYFVISQNIWADYYDNNYYVTSKGENNISVFDSAEHRLLFSGYVSGCGLTENHKNPIPFLSFDDEKLFSISANIVVYSLHNKNEECIGITKELFVVAGLSYIEVYNSDGRLLYTVEHDGNLERLKLWPNGYISFYISDSEDLGYYDREMKKHICSNNGLKFEIERNIRPSIIDISDDCVIIKAYRCQYLLFEDRVVLEGLEIEKIDEYNYLGIGYNIEIGRNSYCIFNTKIGKAVVYGDYNCLYLVK